jgi:hypothetical protein
MFCKRLAKLGKSELAMAMAMAMAMATIMVAGAAVTLDALQREPPALAVLRHAQG